MELVKTVKMGRNLLISGSDPKVVEAALQAMVKKGAKVVSPVHQLGARWMATCEDLDDPVRRCEVVKVGAQSMIKGPTRDAVQTKLAEFVERGARVIANPKENNGLWVAVFQQAEPDKAFDRW
jgi:hypothetical protein